MGQSNEDGAGFVHVGFGNFLAVNKMLAIVTPASAPIQQMIREGERRGSNTDYTEGRRPRAVVFTDTGGIVLLAITPEALAGRVAASRSGRADQAAAD